MTKKKIVKPEEKSKSQEKIERVAKVIDTLLKNEECALSPYLDATQAKIEARVRLVDVSEKEDVKETTKKA